MEIDVYISVVLFLYAIDVAIISANLRNVLMSEDRD